MIRKVFLMCSLFFAFNAIMAQQNIVKASAIVGNVGLQYERSISDHISLIGQAGVSNLSPFVDTYTFGGFSGTEYTDVGDSSTGFGFYLEGRYYFSSNKDLMEGWHIGPYYNNISMKSSDDEETKISSFGISTGYQWVFDSQLTFDIVFGAGTLDLETDYDAIEVLGDIGFLPHFGIALGYNF